MTNQVKKPGSEASSSMGNTGVPVLFALKNVQPLILGAGPSVAKHGTTPPNNATKSASTAQVQSSISPSTTAESAVLTKPTKTRSAGLLLRQAGTILVILLIFLVVRMSVPGGTSNTELARDSSNEKSNAEPATTEIVANDSKLNVPSLPRLETTSIVTNNTEDQIEEESRSFSSTLGNPQDSIELGSAGPVDEVPSLGIELKAPTNPSESGFGQAPKLLAATPFSTTSSPVPNPSIPNGPEFNMASRPFTPALDVRETSSDSLMIPQVANASESPSSPAPGFLGTQSQPTSNVRQTNKPDFDAMETMALANMYEAARNNSVPNNVVPNSSPANAPMNSNGTVTATPISTSQPVTQSRLPIPYKPVGTLPDGTQASAAPANGQVDTSAKNAIPMTGQAYPAPQPDYKPLPVPAPYEQPIPPSTGSSSTPNRYPPLIRQPTGTANDASGMITQPKPSYIPIGTPTNGSTGGSFGYPPINVPK